MNRHIFGLCTIITFLFSFSLAMSQNVHSADTPYAVIANDVLLNDNIIRVNLNNEGFRIEIIWVDENNQQHQKFHFARMGNHAYEMRDHPNWKGRAKVVVVTIATDATGTIQQPTLTDELDMFMAVETQAAYSINFLYGITFFSYQWQMVVLTIFIASIFICRLLPRQSWITSSLLAFIFAWGLMDIRQAYDRFYINRHADDNQNIKIIRNLYMASDTFKPQLKGHRWSGSNLVWPFSTLAAYNLAEFKYAPMEAKPAADFLVEQQINRLILKENNP